MASHVGKENQLISFIQDNLFKFSFYQLLRYVQLNLPEIDLRFLANLDLSFPEADIANVKFMDNQLHIKQNLFNLIGQNALLPDHMTEYVINHVDDKNHALLDFLNIFINKAIQLYYQSWRNSAFFIQHEQLQDQELFFKDATIATLASLIGMDSTITNIELAKNVFLYHAGMFVTKIRTAKNLTDLLINFFQLPIQVLEFDGQWLEIDKLDCSSINYKKHLNQLGGNAMLGERVWHIQNHFKVVIGPLDYSCFLELLPNKPMLKTMREIIRFFVGSEYHANIEIIINYPTIPFLKLASDHSKAYQLGWNAWLKTKTQPDHNPIVKFRINH